LRPTEERESPDRNGYNTGEPTDEWIGRRVGSPVVLLLTMSYITAL